jgi:hypothetical protein
VKRHFNMTEYITNIIFRITLLICVIYTIWQTCILWKFVKSLRKPKNVIQHPIRSAEVVEMYRIALTQQRRFEQIRFLDSPEGFQAASEVSSLCNQLGIKMETDLEDDEEILN